MGRIFRNGTSEDDIQRGASKPCFACGSPVYPWACAGCGEAPKVTLACQECHVHGRRKRPPLGAGRAGGPLEDTSPWGDNAVGQMEDGE